MTQAQQDVLNLLLPPRDLIPELIEILRTRHQDGVTARSLAWLVRVREIYEMQKPHIIGSVSDEELQGIIDMAEDADLWAVIE
jgi:hypothetical protein